MHPYAVDRLVQERQQELARLRHADHASGAHRVPTWRRSAGRALLELALRVGVPPARRTPARQSGLALLGFGCTPDGSAG